MLHNTHHTLKHLKYISLLNIKIIRLIYENKIERAKHLNDFKFYIKKQLPDSYKRTL